MQRGRRVTDPVFAAVEATALSIWLRDAVWAFPGVLIGHTIGLALLVGANVAIDARILGGASGIPLRALDPYFRVAWAGFWVNAASGVLLLLAYPTKALTNPLFYVKLLVVAAALLLMRAIRSHMHDQHATDRQLRSLAVLSLACWMAGTAAGRFLAYTYTRLQVLDI